jgi:hypothetical protein
MNASGVSATFVCPGVTYIQVFRGRTVTSGFASFGATCSDGTVLGPSPGGTGGTAVEGGNCTVGFTGYVWYADSSTSNPPVGLAATCSPTVPLLGRVGSSSSGSSCTAGTFVVGYYGFFRRAAAAACTHDDVAVSH